jgi:hypothetical protein
MYLKRKKAEGSEPFALISFAERAGSTLARSFCPATAVAKHRQFHRTSAKAHRFTGAGCPDVDPASADCSAGVGYEVFAAVAGMFESHA